MSPSITLTGSLTLQSQNGDASALLTEAAEIVSRLAKLGIVVGARVELAPVHASPAPAEPEPEPVVPPKPPLNLAQSMQEISATIGKAFDGLVGPASPPAYDRDAGRTFNSEPAVGVVDETQEVEAVAGPELSVALQALIRKMERNEAKFRNLSRDTQKELITLVGAKMTVKGRAPEKQTWNEHKPDWMPTAHALAYWEGGPTWAEWQARFVVAAKQGTGAAA